MLTEAETRVIAQRVLGETSEVCLNPQGPAHVDDDFVVWTFNTVEYWKTGNPLAGLAGNLPIAVSRHDGSVHRLEVTESIKAALDRLHQR